MKNVTPLYRSINSDKILSLLECYAKVYVIIIITTELDLYTTFSASLAIMLCFKHFDFGLAVEIIF